MEIASLSQNSLRIKGKRAVFIVDPPVVKASKGDNDKSVISAVLKLTATQDQVINNTDIVVIAGPGEYEIGGVKMNAGRYENDLVFNLVVDGVELILGKLSSLEKAQHKLKEQHIVAAYADTAASAAFITSLASNVVIFYGEKASEAAETFGKANVAKISKYTTTLEKLPAEVETFILE